MVRFSLQHFVLPVAVLACLSMTGSARGYVYESTVDHIPLHWLDQDPSTPDTVDIYYDFRDYNNYANVVTPAEQAVFVSAMNDWSTITGGKIVFTQSTTVAAGNILNLGVSDLAAVDSASGGNILGVCLTFYGTDGAIPKSIVRLDYTKPWDLNIGNGNPAGSSATAYDFYTVALHEIGHALGLNHSESFPGNIMTAILYGEKLGPAADDINGVDNNYSVDPSLYYNSIVRSLPSLTVGSPYTDGNARYYNYYNTGYDFYIDAGTTTVSGATTVEANGTFHQAGGVWNSDMLIIGVTNTNPVTVELSAGVLTANTVQLNAGAVLTVSGGTLQAQNFSINDPSATFTWTGGTLSIVNGGMLLNVPDLVVPAGGIFRTTGSHTFHSLAIIGSVQLVRNGAMRTVTRVVDLSILPTAGKLDVGDNFLIVEPMAGAKAAAIQQLAGEIRSGRNDGDWLGAGITSSSVALDPAHVAVGLFDNGVLGLLSFGGSENNVDSLSLLITPAFLGDANFDARVDASDLAVIAGHWHTFAGDWADGDLNLDGFVDSLDAQIVVSHWSSAVPFGVSADYLPEFSYLLIPVPEPASLGLLLLAIPALVGRRIRRRGLC